MDRQWENDYFNLNKHFKINNDLDSTVVHHQIIDTPLKDDSAVSKVLRDIHLQETKKIIEIIEGKINDIDTSNSDSDFGSPMNNFSIANDAKLRNSPPKIPKNLLIDNTNDQKIV